VINSPSALVNVAERSALAVTDSGITSGVAHGVSAVLLQSSDVGLKFICMLFVDAGSGWNALTAVAMAARKAAEDNLILFVS
jgi:hypothetical protein